MVMEIIGNYCPTIGKECFDSRYLAQKAVDRLNKKASKKGCVYQCPDCGKWHITHYSYQHNKDINSKRKKEMAGKGKFKIGADVGYVDSLGNPLICGAYVRHIITGKEGTITQYGVVKGIDGTNYKLCDNFWEVVGNAFKKEEPIDLGIADCDLEVKDVKKDVAVVENKVTGEKKLAVVCEKTLADFDTCDIITEVISRGLLNVFLESNYEDASLASELRKRGYEVKAEKTIVVSL